MTNSTVSVWLGYVLWLGVGGCLVWAGWFLPETSQSLPAYSLSQRPRYCLIDTSGQAWLLSLQPVTRLTQTPTSVQIGVLSLPVSQTMIGNERYWLPMVSSDWKQVMTSLLGGQSTDSARRWQTTRQQWRKFVQPEVDSFLRIASRPTLTEEQLLTHTLLRRLERSPGRSAYGLDSTLHDLTGVTSVSVQTPTQLSLLTQPVNPNPSPLRHGLVGVGLLIVLGGLFQHYTHRQTMVSKTTTFSDPEAEPDYKTEETPLAQPVQELVEQPVSEPVPALPVAEDSLLNRYLLQFYERYGDFYQYLQDIPIEPDETQKQEIRRRMVEMALHAHSLARAYKHNPSLDRITDEPNLQLIWQKKQVQELTPGSYKPFEEEAYGFVKKHQFLQQILREMNLGHLNGVLMQTIYLPPAHL